MIEARQPAAAGEAPARWSRRQVLNWIAFGKASDENLVGVAHSDDCDPGLLAALEAKTEGRPFWVPSAPPRSGLEWMMVQEPPSYAELRLRCDALIERRGRTAADLASEMRLKLAAFEKRLVKFEAAKARLNDALDSERICVRPPPTASVPGISTMQMPPNNSGEWFQRASVIELWRNGTTEMLPVSTKHLVVSKGTERKKRGVKPIKQAAIARKMLAEILDGTTTLEELQHAKQEALAKQYDASRETVQIAMRQVASKMSELEIPINSDH